jgi:hypothetical protein
MNIKLYVTPENLDTLISRIEYINKKANELNVPEINYTIAPSGKKFLVNIDKEIVRIDGWKVTHMIRSKPTYLVFNFDTMETESSYHGSEQVCEHCNSNRNRIKTYILENELGEKKRIGSSCVKHFSGHKLDSYLNHCSYIEKVIEEDWERGVKDLSAVKMTSEYLAVCIQLIHMYGYKNSESGDATKDSASKMYNSQEFRVTEENYKLAQDVLDYFKNYEFRSDFNKNIKNALDCHVTNFGREGFIAYAYVAYTNLTKVEVETNYVGEVGTKQELELTYIRTVSMYGAYGENYLVIFRDENNNEIVWTTANGISHLTNNAVSSSDSGKKVKLFTTIKAHKMYQNKKQTYITRPKFIA